MNAAHLHLFLNHFPATGLIFSTLLLGLGLLRSNSGFICSGLVIVLLSGVLTVPAYLSGEGAEEVIEHSAGFSEPLVEGHEEAAYYAIWTMGITAIAAAAGLFFSMKKGRIPKPLMIFIIISNLFSFSVVARTSYLGGQISHPEIRDLESEAAFPEIKE